MYSESLSVYTNKKKSVKRLIVVYAEYYGASCDPISSDVITYSYSYNVLKSSSNEYTLFTKSIEVELSEQLYHAFNCSQSTTSKSIDNWFCYKNGVDIFTKEKNMLGKTTSASLSFGVDFAYFNKNKLSLVMGGEDSGFCNENDISQTILTVVITICATILIICCCCCCCCMKGFKSCFVCSHPKRQIGLNLCFSNGHNND